MGDRLEPESDIMCVALGYAMGESYLPMRLSRVERTSSPIVSYPFGTCFAVTGARDNVRNQKSNRIAQTSS